MKNTEARWKEVIKELQASGLSVREFAKKKQVSRSCLYMWRKRIEGGRYKKATPCKFSSVVLKSSSNLPATGETKLKLGKVEVTLQGLPSVKWLQELSGL